MESYTKLTPSLADVITATPTAATDHPRSLKLESATLSYRIRDEEKWRVLRRAGREGTFNIGPILFETDSISITQESNGNRCVLKLEKGAFAIKTLTLAMHPGKLLGNVFEVQCNTAPRCDFKSYTGDKGIAKAEEFPLAKNSDQMYRIRLQLSGALGQWKILGGARAERPESLALVKWQLKQLCGGSSSVKPTGKNAEPKPRSSGATQIPVRRPASITSKPVPSSTVPENPSRPGPTSYVPTNTPPPSPMPQSKPAEISLHAVSSAYAGATTPQPPPLITNLQPPSARKRTRAEIDAEYDELEKEEEVLARLVRCRERKRQLEEERKSVSTEGNAHA